MENLAEVLEQVVEILKQVAIILGIIYVPTKARSLLTEKRAREQGDAIDVLVDVLKKHDEHYISNKTGVHDVIHAEPKVHDVVAVTPEEAANLDHTKARLTSIVKGRVTNGKGDLVERKYIDESIERVNGKTAQKKAINTASKVVGVLAKIVKAVV